MKRRLFTILAALSLLLFVAMVVLWVRSYWVGDSFRVIENGIERRQSGDHGELSREYAVWLGRGALAVSVSEHEVRLGGEFDGAVMRPPSPAWQVTRSTFEPRREPSYEVSAWGRWRHRWRGFGIGVEDYRGNKAQSLLRYVTMPYLSLCFVTAAVASLCICACLRVSRPGLCRRCGYDLRATPERCPECGAVPAKQSERRVAVEGAGRWEEVTRT